MGVVQVLLLLHVLDIEHSGDFFTMGTLKNLMKLIHNLITNIRDKCY